MDGRPDLCIHLAWYAQPGKYLSSPLNLQHLQAGLHLGKLLAKAGCHRLVVAGTCAEYDTEAGLSFEASPTPGQPVRRQQVALGLLAQLAAQLDLELAWARNFYVYGPYEDERRFVPAVIGSVLRARPPASPPAGRCTITCTSRRGGALWAVGAAA